MCEKVDDVADKFGSYLFKRYEDMFLFNVLVSWDYEYGVGWILVELIFCFCGCMSVVDWVLVELSEY